MSTEVLLVVGVLIGVTIMYMVARMRPEDSPSREEVMRAELEQAKMLSRLYDDPDFIKDMGLDEEEQRYLHR